MPHSLWSIPESHNQLILFSVQHASTLYWIFMRIKWCRD
jgi:hypothetical protein